MKLTKLETVTLETLVKLKAYETYVANKGCRPFRDIKVQTSEPCEAAEFTDNTELVTNLPTSTLLQELTFIISWLGHKR